MAQLKDLLVAGDSRFAGNVYSTSPKVAYGTCSTAADTAAKVATINDPTWNLQIGDIIGIKFSNSNSASSCTLNVNNTGAKSFYYNNAAYTGSSTIVCGTANRVNYYMYDGTYWVWMNYGTESSNSDTYPSAYCSTGAGTAAKAATCSGYVLLSKSFLHVIITNSNTSASALTFNVNSKGAKPIYINGTASSSSNYTLPAGSYLVYYDGTNYYFRTDGKLTASITGDAATVNGKTVAVNVPSDAKFTDTTYESKSAASGGTAVSLCTTGEKYTWNNKASTNTTYSFAGGTNKFTVTPSGGTATDVAVTPSITNNVTGTGTSGYLAKFDGAHTITSGPQLGSSTTTYLTNKGTWATPPGTYSLPTAASGTLGGIKVGDNLSISSGVLSAKPTNLYNNTTGSNTSVTLSSSAANFNYLDIFYKGAGYYNCTRVYAPNGKDVSLMSNTSGDYANLVVQMSFATATISGTTITLKNQAMINFSNTNGNYNWKASNTYIVRVDGYK